MCTDDPGGGPSTTMDQHYWQAVAAGDRRSALAAVKRLRAEGATTAEILRDHLLVAQHRVGELWMTGEWSVAQEHTATSVNEGLLLWLGSFNAQPRRDGPLVLVACVEDEQHAFASLVVSEILMAHGLRVDHVGGAPEADALLERAINQRSDAVLLSASLTSSLGRASALVKRLRDQGMRVVVGGQAFGDDEKRARAIGASAWCAGPEEAVAWVTAIAQDPQSARLSGTVAAAASEDVAWLEEYREQMVAYVTVGLRRSGHAPDADPGDLEGWVDHLVGCLSATLATDDETILLEANDWLGRVLTARGHDPELVDRVLDLLREPVASRPAAAGLVHNARILLAAARRPTGPLDLPRSASPQEDRPPAGMGETT